MSFIYENVLVTGGAGFVGSQLVNRLLPLSRSITVIDDCSTGRSDNVPQSERLTFIEASYVDEALLDRVLPDATHVFHLACKNLVLSAEHADEDFHVNLYGGYLLLKKTQQLSTRLQHFLYTSTASVYGNAPILPTPEAWYSTELPYSASKFSTEHYCQVFHRMHAMPISVLRLSNVYGPGQHISNPYCGVVAKFFDFADRNEPLTIYGDGHQTRDYTYIEDAIDAIILASTHDSAAGQVYNIGTGIETSVNELAAMVATISGTQHGQLVYCPKRKVDVVRRRCLDAAKIGRELQWQPKVDLQEGLRRTNLWRKEGAG